MAEAKFDVLTIGNAIVDVLAHTEEDFLVREGLVKGSMRLIDGKEADRLFEHMGPSQLISGGCAGNTAAGVASFGGRAAFIGKVADDELGRFFRHDMHALGIHFPTAPLTDGTPTARSMILITPDSERTMNTYLAACQELTPADIDRPTVEGAAITYLEGYLWDPPKAKEAFRIAARLAHGAEAQGGDHALRFLLRRPLSRRVHRADAHRRARHRLRQPARGAVALPDQRFRDGGRLACERDIELAVVTMSEEGSMVVAEGKRIAHPGGEGGQDRRSDRRRRPLSRPASSTACRAASRTRSAAASARSRRPRSSAMSARGR